MGLQCTEMAALARRLVVGDRIRMTWSPISRPTQQFTWVGTVAAVDKKRDQVTVRYQGKGLFEFPPSAIEASVRQVSVTARAWNEVIESVRAAPVLSVKQLPSSHAQPINTPNKKSPPRKGRGTLPSSHKRKQHPTTRTKTTHEKHHGGRGIRRDEAVLSAVSQNRFAKLEEEGDLSFLEEQQCHPITTSMQPGEGITDERNRYHQSRGQTSRSVAQRKSSRDRSRTNRHPPKPIKLKTVTALQMSRFPQDISASDGREHVELSAEETHVTLHVNSDGRVHADWCQHTKGKRHFLREPRPLTRNGGVLAEVPRTRINLAAVLEDGKKDGMEVAPLEILLSEDESLFKIYTKANRISRFMIQHKEHMVSMGIIEECSEAEMFMDMFTVPKKDDTLRLIQNCIPLNEQCSRAPPMRLPTIHQYQDFLMEGKYVATCDARAFFYQIQLPRKYRKYFGMRLAGARGQLVVARMTVLPMGWSWSPAIAQCIANILCRPIEVGGRPIAMAWVDNFAIVGRTLEEFERNRIVFLERLNRYNLIVDDYELAPKQQATVLGMKVDLVAKTVVLKDLKAILNDPTTYIELYQQLGSLIWSATVKRQPLCRFPHAMQAMASVAKKIQCAADWNDTLELSFDQLHDLRRWKHLYMQNSPFLWSPPGVATMVMYSDASDTHGAYFGYVEHSQDVLTHHQQRMNEEEHIFLKELRMAVQAVKAAHQLQHIPHLFVDNMPVLHAMQRRLSTNFVANRLLSQLENLNYTISWVPSIGNLADPFTRGEVFGHQWSLQDIVHCHAYHANKVGGSYKEDLPYNV